MLGKAMNTIPVAVAPAAGDGFIDTLPAFADFEGVADTGNYRPLPEGWALATADIVSSSKAIEAGGYKAVNMAGAAVISAVTNGTGLRNLPFVFGGDGAVVAVPSFATGRTREALAAVKTWVREELELDLRAALVPVADIRAQGLDVRVARFQASPEVSYAMFSGGGASWAEAEMKAGRYAVPAAAPGTRPDLTGLSCRWNPIGARHGEIVSIIVLPGADGNNRAFQQLVSDIVALAAEQERGAHPLPADGPEFGFRLKSLDYEARAIAPAGARLGGRLRRLAARLSLLAQVTVGSLIFRIGRKAGPFDPDLYRRDVTGNSDFRKFDDGLKMTLDIDAAHLARIERRLAEAVAAGHCRYGLHRQSSALITCIAPSVYTRDHMHFIDGADGGYAMAARNLKSALPAA
jgi:hypothetical protein